MELFKKIQILILEVPECSDKKYKRNVTPPKLRQIVNLKYDDVCFLCDKKTTVG